MQRYRVVVMIVLFGLLPVVAAFFFTLWYLGAEEEALVPAPVPLPIVQPEPPETAMVLASARALSAGRLLDEADMIGIEIDPGAIRREYFVIDDTMDAGRLAGHVMRVALDEGVPLTRSAVIGPHEPEFLAAVLRPGMRAVTVPVEEEATGSAGLVGPGDRVDVILYARYDTGGVGEREVARTIVEDARVIAVDMRTIGDDNSAETLPLTDEGDSSFTTVTLEVSPIHDDRLVLGWHTGQFSLAARPLARVSEAVKNDAVDLQELLMSRGEFAELQERRSLNDLSNRAQSRAQIAEYGAQLRTATQEPAVVRILRGSEAAEEVVFTDRSEAAEEAGLADRQSTSQ